MLVTSQLRNCLTAILSGLAKGAAVSALALATACTHTTTTMYDGGASFEASEAAAASSQVEDSASSVTPLLDLLGFTEGTDKGDGYNETLAYGAYTGGDVNLTDMTLAQIDSLQTQMLAHPANVWNSSAIGRYQIVRTTLRKLKKQMGLSDDERFTPDLQDRMAVELLVGRGFNAWKEGLITDEEFALNLSKEWASMPNPKTGKGYYSGQNAAVGYAAVKAVLDEVRAAERRVAMAPVPSTRELTLSATQSAEGAIQASGKVEIATGTKWDVSLGGLYDFGSDSFEIEGSAAYRTEKLQFSISGADSDEQGTSFAAKLELSF